MTGQNDYQQALDWLYVQAPAFHKIGAGAYKPGLEHIRALDREFGSPWRSYRTIHVAGTNGKGSTSACIAAALRASGLKTGLYTSPHLVDFRERIVVDGRMVSPDFVADFISRFRGREAEIDYSFFELTTMMAFEWFRREAVDVAVIETGLGGRLDSTNIIRPDLCVITSISLDHTAQLGDTLEQIAAEKAGIIKPGVPVVVSGHPGPGVEAVFRARAQQVGAPICVVAEDDMFVEAVDDPAHGRILYRGTPFGDIACDLTGRCQPMNMAGVLKALQLLELTPTAVRDGLANVCLASHFRGRWTRLADRPVTIIDTGHNCGGWELLAPQIAALPAPRHLVLGFVSDKDLTHIFDLLRAIPDTHLHFAQATTPRALPAATLLAAARAASLSGTAYPPAEPRSPGSDSEAGSVKSAPPAGAAGSVKSAYAAALAACPPTGSIFIGGSNFVVGDLLRPAEEL